MGYVTEEQKAQAKRNAAYYLSQGRCPNCGGKRPIAPGRKKCFDCLEKAAAKARRAIANETPEKRDDRQEKQRKYKAARTRYAQENGLCSYHLRPVLPGRRLCLECLVRSRRRQEQQRIEHSKTGVRRSDFRGYGLCGICGSPELREGTRVCERCYQNNLVNISKAIAARKEQKRGGQANAGN